MELKTKFIYVNRVVISCWNLANRFWKSKQLYVYVSQTGQLSSE